MPTPTGDDPITRGFVCTTTPTEAYGPGFVYSIDEAGNQQLVSLLTDQAQTFRFRTLFGTYNATLTRSGGLKLALDTSIDNVSGNLDLGAASSQETRVSFADGELVLMNDAGARKVEEIAKADLTPVAGNSYFVVRDAIQAKGIDISLSRSDEAHLGGHAALEGIVSADPNLAFKGDSGLIVSGKFDAPLNVCLRAVRLEPVTRSEPAEVSGGTEWRLTTEAAPASGLARLLSK